MSSREQRLRHVLADQRFPAQRWELVSAAETYGADADTRADLRGIPERSYENVQAVVIAAERRVALAARG